MSQVKVYINQELTDKICEDMKTLGIDEFSSVIRWVLCEHYGVSFKPRQG